MSPSTSTKSTSSVPTFESIGVRPLVNCRGTFTIISGSRALPQVAEAMLKATDAYVHMDELMEAVGRRLGELTGAEWGYITSGCAAGLAQVTAASIAGADPERIAHLPDTTGMKNEVIAQKAHRNVYDHAVRMAGAKTIEVETEADLLAAISDRTAMFYITGDAHRAKIPIGRMVEIGHQHGIPSLVDAAAERPDIPNYYLGLGADAVAYSGGKCLRGPQAAGLVLGRKALLQAAFLNGAPHHSFGRPMKAGKEEIMGLLAAVEAWVKGRDHQAEWKYWQGSLGHISQAIADIPSVEKEVVQPGLSNVAPTLSIWWNQEVVRISPDELRRELLEGEPRIIVSLRGQGISIMPYMMEEGEEAIVARRLREVLQAATRRQKAQPMEPPPAQVAGVWLITLKYLLGESQHSATLEQDGSRLAGCYRSQYGGYPVEGTVKGDEVAFRMVITYESSHLPYTFAGKVEGDRMLGQVDLGEYWSATFSAERLGG